MSIINWGIIGCGNVTEVKSGPGFQKARDSMLAAVMGRDAARAEDYARRHGVPKWYSRTADLINDPEVTAVSIATPPGSHRELALQVCAAGKPCLVEKPMARNYGECREMVAAFREAGIPLFVAYYRRGFPKFIHIKKMVQDGALGRIERIDLRYIRKKTTLDLRNLPWRFRPEISGGGLVADVGSHGIDILQFIFGTMAVTGSSLKPNTDPRLREEDVALDFRCGDTPGRCLWRFHQPAGPEEDAVIVTGTQGALRFSIFEAEPYTVIPASGPMREFPFTPPEHVQQPLIQTIVDDLNGAGKCPSTGETAAETNRVMDFIYRNTEEK
jgi:predicted dehydrogenase